MAVQEAILLAGDRVAVSGSWSLTGGGSANNNLKDGNYATGVVSSGPGEVRHEFQNPTIPAGAIIDYVQLRTWWVTGATTKLHFGAMISVDGDSYNEDFSYNGKVSGVKGDTWVGNVEDNKWVYGAVHPKRPSARFWTAADVNSIRVTYRVYEDSDVDVSIREARVDVYYYRKPTVSNLVVTGAPENVEGRNLTWDYSGDGPQHSYEVYIVSIEKALDGWEPGDGGYIHHGIVKSGLKSFDIRGITSNGTYVVLVRACLVGQKSSQECWSDWAPLAFVVDQNPQKPDIISPSNDATIPLEAGGWYSSFKFNHPDPSATPNTYTLMRALVSDHIPKYWRESDRSWQVAETSNPANPAVRVQTKVWSPSDWEDGVHYEWKVRFTDQDAKVSPWSDLFTIVGNGSPSATITFPTASLTVSNEPTVSWTYSDPEDEAQELYEIKVWKESVYSADSFDPSTSETYWTSGRIASADTSHAMDYSLESGANYRFGLRVRSAFGLWSTWDYSDVYVSLSGNARPTLLAISRPSEGNNYILVQGHDNLMSFDDSTFDDSSRLVGNWVFSGCTGENSGDEAKSGGRSLKLTSTSSNYYYATCSELADLYMQCNPGLEYQAIASLLASSSPNESPAEIWLRFHDVNKEWLGADTDIKGAPVTTDSASWTQISVTGVAPPGAAYVSAVVAIDPPNNGNIHYIDEAGIFPAPCEEWARGGALGSARIQVDFSDDGGRTWTMLRGGDLYPDPYNGQLCAIVDYEFISGKQRMYRARSYMEVEA